MAAFLPVSRSLYQAKAGIMCEISSFTSSRAFAIPASALTRANHQPAVWVVDPRTETVALRTVIEIFKKREVYRHLANMADRLAHAGDTLHDIVVKMV